MSRCWTLTHTGMVEGIALSATYLPNNPHGVALGEDWTNDYSGEVTRIKKRSIFVSLDRFDPPLFSNDLLKEARLAKGGDKSFLRRGRPNDAGVLVYIDTAHTEPCVTGGSWETLSGNPLTVARGKEGFCSYTLNTRSEWRYFEEEELRERIEEETCYDLGLVLMMPGDRLKVRFHAPGSVVGTLEYRTKASGLKFELTENEVDRDYRYEQPDHQSEYEMKQMLPWHPFDSGYDM
jgi:hypothetical protein